MYKYQVRHIDAGEAKITEVIANTVDTQDGVAIFQNDRNVVAVIPIVSLISVFGTEMEEADEEPTPKSRRGV